ncbi:MAG: efflux transporter outer membrane subunit [Verrucomicrobiota bacterium]
MVKLFLCLFSLVLLAACKLGPEYRRPSVEAPPDWRWKQAEPRDHVPRGEWWKVFNDPVLDQLQADAAAANQELKAAMARVEQARATARFNRSDFFPSLNGTATYARYRTSGNAPSPVPFPVPSFTQTTWQSPWDLTYEVDLWGKVRRGFEAAREQALGADAARQFVLLTVQSDVAVNYLSLQSTFAEIELLKKTIQIREEALEIFRQRLAVGLGTEFEIQRARVEVESAKADLAAAEQRRAELLNALALLCGKAPSQFTVAVNTGLARLPEIAPDLPSSLLERRPDVAQAERELAARNAQIGIARTAYFPSLRLTASGGVLSGEFTDLFDWESRIWSIGPSFSIPVFSGGRAKSNLQRAQAAYDEAVALYRQKILVAFREVEDSLAALNHLREQLRARTEAAGAASNAASLSFERYKAGAVNFLEIVDAEQARLANEVARVRVANEQRLATVRLIKALGGGWE